VQISSFAQNAFQYQAVVRNNDGSVIVDQNINVRFSIIQNSTEGSSIYSEAHQTITNSAGLVKLQVGTGSVENGIFSQIDWSVGSYFIKTEIDKGTGYSIIGIQELLSVPYSIFTEKAGGIQKKSTNGTAWSILVNDNGSLSSQIVKDNIIPIPTGYSNLVFNDEFNGQGLPNPDKWGYEVGFVRNHEMQYYTNAREQNTFQKDGSLTIRCINNDTLKNASGEILNRSTVNNKDYYITSGSVRTKTKGDWKYCRVEVKVKIPAGSGTWPAIWMLPTDNFYGYWPKSGEIDIMEFVGNEPYKLHYTAHFNTGAKGFSSTSYSSTTEWHVFAFEWHEDRMEWYCDGRIYGRYKNPNTTWEAWPFDQRFYLILNFAFGGGWGGRDGFDTNILPLDYLIDYVRVFN